jgi:O-antigen/teichoic acid export membrane protein
MATANKENPTYYLLKYLRVSSLLSFPVFFGISAIATFFVPVFLGDKWTLAIVPLQVIAFVMPLRAAETAISPYLYAQGLVKTAFFNKSISLVLLVVSLLIGSRWGLDGVTWAWAIGYLLTFAVVLRRTCAVTSLSASRVTAIIFKMGTPACFMYASLFVIRKYALSDSIDPALALGTLIASGAVLYAVAAWSICRPEISELRGLVRRPATS